MALPRNEVTVTQISEALRAQEAWLLANKTTPAFRKKVMNNVADNNNLMNIPQPKKKARKKAK